MEEDLLDLIASWKIALLALNRSPKTIEGYMASVAMYAKWCSDTGVTNPFSRESIRAFIAHCLENGAAPATAQQRHYALKSFTKWLLVEGEIDADPFAGSSPPKLTEKIVPSMTDDQVQLMLSTCKGSAKFIDRRDEAILRFMFETGIRSQELCSMNVQDVDLVSLTAKVLKAKGLKQRVVPFSSSTAAAVDRYLRARKKVVKPGCQRLWVGVNTGTGIGYQAMYLTLRKRAEQVGITDFHPHRTRHTAATRWLRRGGSEAGLMSIAGWSSRSMMDRYTAASAAERAIEESKRLDLGF